MSDSVKVIIKKPDTQEETGTSGRQSVKVPEPIAVHRDQWDALGWNQKSVAEVRVDEDETKIYVNLDNTHIDTLVRAGSYQEQGVKRMQNSYLLYTAFYAWVQHQALAGKDFSLEGKEIDGYKTSELDRVAQTVVHTISAIGRMPEDG